jgi:Predicted metal-dependent hydrolase of the TIM-barrel fold
MTTSGKDGAGGLVDAHHHIWRRADLAWLQGPMVPRIFGAYEPIRRDYPIEEYLADAVPAGVAASVYVQTNWPLERSLDEVRWVQEVHEQTGWPSAIVGCADLFAVEAAGVIAAELAASPLLRGIRLQLHWHEDERFRFASAPDRMNDPVLRRNVARLADLGLVFELQVFSSQMADAARFVAALPRVTFVLLHAGMLESAAEEHVAPWLAGLDLLAEQPNLTVKLSGQGTFVHRVDEELIELVARASLERFGPERCMFGSNFPIEKLWTDYGTLLGAWKNALGSQPEAVRREVFSDTARRVYAL